MKATAEPDVLDVAIWCGEESKVGEQVAMIELAKLHIKPLGRRAKFIHIVMREIHL